MSAHLSLRLRDLCPISTCTHLTCIGYHEPVCDAIALLLLSLHALALHVSATPSLPVMPPRSSRSLPTLAPHQSALVQCPHARLSLWLSICMCPHAFPTLTASAAFAPYSHQPTCLCARAFTHGLTCIGPYVPPPTNLPNLPSAAHTSITSAPTPTVLIAPLIAPMLLHCYQCYAMLLLNQCLVLILPRSTGSWVLTGRESPSKTTLKAHDFINIIKLYYTIIYIRMQLAYTQLIYTI